MTSAPEPPPGRQPNIFALPSQTSLIFCLMVAVLVGAIFLGSLAPGPVCLWPVGLGMIFIPFRSFLARSGSEITRRGLVPAGESLAPLQNYIHTIAVQIGLSRSPLLLVRDGKLPGSPYTFGTPKHWYIAASREDAAVWQNQLACADSQPAAQARILHELYHFKTGDYWKMGYTRELLRLTFLFTGWAILFFLGWGILLVLAYQGFFELNFPELFERAGAFTPAQIQLLLQFLPASEDMEALRLKASGVNFGLVLNYLVASLFPFVLAGLFLRLFLYPKLWQVRELYADAGVSHNQKELLPFFSALSGIDLPILKHYPTVLSKIIADIHCSKDTLLGKRKTLYQYHTSWQNRLVCLCEPERVYGNWWGTALLAGGVALVFDIILVSPLTLMAVGDWPMHFPFLAVLVLVSVGYLIPTVALGRNGLALLARTLLKMTSVIVGIRLAWLLFTLGVLFSLLFLAPEFLAEILAGAFAAVARYAGQSTGLGDLDIQAFVVQAAVLNLTQVVIIFLVLLAAFASMIFLLSRLFRWYRLPEAGRRLLWAAYGVVGLPALFFGLVILPSLTTALFRPEDFLRPQSWIYPLLSLLISACGLALFLILDRKYADVCPHCGERVHEAYQVGKCCSACQKELFEWLSVEYRW